MKEKRWSEGHAIEVAQRFSGSDHAEAWDLFGSTIRRALIDSWVMDELRIADSVDSAIAFTATEVVNFRDLVARKLAAGVKPYSGARRASRRFAVID